MHLLPHFFFFIVFNVENNKTEKQQGHANGKARYSQISKSQSKHVIQIIEQSKTLFLASPF